MPTPNPNVFPTGVVVRQAQPAKADEPPPAPFTCAWAQDGLARAVDGLGVASSGVSEYHIGSRGLHYKEAGNQLKTVDWWSKMVELFCGESPIPPEATGRDTARRVILSDA